MAVDARRRENLSDAVTACEYQASEPSLKSSGHCTSLNACRAAWQPQQQQQQTVLTHKMRLSEEVWRAISVLLLLLLLLPVQWL